MTKNRTSFALLAGFLSMLLSTTSLSQDIMGTMKLGKKDNPAETNGYFGGLKGVLMAFDLDDGRTFQIAFAPSEDGKNITRIKQPAFDDLVDEMKKIYGVQFKKTYLEEDTEDYVLEGYNGKYAYYIDARYDPKQSYPYDVMISIVDMDLEAIAVEEGK